MDFYMSFVKLFATWFRLRIVMAATIVLLIILMSLSAWTTQADGGSFASITFPSGRRYNNWYYDVCETTPYAFLSPFQFTYSYTNGTQSYSSSSNSYCPWPVVNSGFRIAGTCLSMVTLGALFVKTPLSLFARPIHAFYALFFFALFVIDSAVQSEGQTFCSQGFSHTDLATDMSSLGMAITCSSDGESAIVVFDIVVSALFFILHSAWSVTADLYIYPQQTATQKAASDRKALLKKDKTLKASEIKKAAAAKSKSKPKSNVSLFEDLDEV